MGRGTHIVLVCTDGRFSRFEVEAETPREAADKAVERLRWPDSGPPICAYVVKAENVFPVADTGTPRWKVADDVE